MIAIDLARFPVSSGSLNAIQLRLAPTANATRKQKQKRQEEERITKKKERRRGGRRRTKANGVRVSEEEAHKRTEKQNSLREALLHAADHTKTFPQFDNPFPSHGNKIQ